MVNTVEPVRDQVVRAVNLIQKHKLDGLDIYWSKSRNLKPNVFLKPNFEVMTSGQYEVRQKRVLEMHQCRQQIYLVSPPTALSN